MTKSYPFFMPSLGDQITLTGDWTFPLENERRNMDFYLRGIVDFSEAAKEAFILSKPKVVRPGSPPGWSYYLPSVHTQNVTLPKGTVLQIDRIYLRKGASDYDSITFLIKGSPDPLLAPMTMKDVRALQAGTKSAKVKPRYTWDVGTPKPSMRFWAKLPDVRRIAGVLVPA